MNEIFEAPEFLTEDELARRWRITIRKLQKDRLEGRGVPFFKFGGAVRYRVSDVLAYEAARQFKSTAEYAKCPV